jgi:phosphoribosylamine--glycine ligase
MPDRYARSRHEETDMNILILGGGGREHALAWAVLQNPKCDRLIVAPGQRRDREIAECSNIDILDNAATVSSSAKKTVFLSLL